MENETDPPAPLEKQTDPLAQFGLDAIDLRWTLKDIAADTIKSRSGFDSIHSLRLIGKPGVGLSARADTVWRRGLWKRCPHMDGTALPRSPKPVRYGYVARSTKLVWVILATKPSRCTTLCLTNSL